MTSEIHVLHPIASFILCPVTNNNVFFLPFLPFLVLGLEGSRSKYCTEGGIASTQGVEGGFGVLAFSQGIEHRSWDFVTVV